MSDFIEVDYSKMDIKQLINTQRSASIIKKPLVFIDCKIPIPQMYHHIMAIKFNSLSHIDIAVRIEPDGIMRIKTGKLSIFLINKAIG